MGPDEQYEDLERAEQRADAAYARARREVYDQYPRSKVGDDADLTPRQRETLNELEAAEQHVRDIRDAMHPASEGDDARV